MSEASLEATDNICRRVVAAADESSRNAPPDIVTLNADLKIVDAAVGVLFAKKLSDEIKGIEGVLAFLTATESEVRKEIRERAESVIESISGDIGTMWATLHPLEPIEDVRLHLPDNDKAIDVALKFYGKEQNSPRLTLSEGYRNSLGLCIFLAMAKLESEYDRPLFLDDVVVSFDRNHRGMIVELLQEEFSERQVVIFTHDRDWFSELRRQLNAKDWSFQVLLPYESPEVGIRWSHNATTFDDARALLRDRPDSAGNDARKIMDNELAAVAEKLKIKLPYLRGDKNDHRMAADFLERIIVDAKKCLQKRAVDGSYRQEEGELRKLEEAYRLLISWGNRGSHTFDVVRPEAMKLIDACEEAVSVFRCQACHRNIWMAHAENQEWVQCQCGETRWRYGKA